MSVRALIALLPGPALAVNGRGIDRQQPRRGADIAAAGGDRGLDGFALDLMQLGGQACVGEAWRVSLIRRLGGVCRGRGQEGGVEFQALSHDHAVADGVFQFAHVARPRVMADPCPCRRAETGEGLAFLFRDAGQQVLGDGMDIVAPFAQWRQGRRQNMQAKKTSSRMVPSATILRTSRLVAEMTRTSACSTRPWPRRR